MTQNTNVRDLKIPTAGTMRRLVITFACYLNPYQKVATLVPRVEVLSARNYHASLIQKQVLSIVQYMMIYMNHLDQK